MHKSVKNGQLKKRASYGRIDISTIDKRLEMAENLLLHSDLTIEKIAISVGFNSKVSFYREFTRKHQMTPAQFREYAECKS